MNPEPWHQTLNPKPSKLQVRAAFLLNPKPPKSLNPKPLWNHRYEPLFPYFAEEKKEVAFKVMVDTYVTDDSGTGVVHQAPAFGEDDYRVCLAHGVISKGESVPCPIDEDGRFTDKVPDFKGMHVKEADKPILAHLKPTGRLVKSGAIKHSYPFCWRSDTPLIYRAVPSWFVKVRNPQPQTGNRKTLDPECQTLIPKP